MQTTNIPCSEEQMQLIQQITHASRQDVLFTIRTSRICARDIIQYLEKLSLSKKKQPQKMW